MVGFLQAGTGAVARTVQSKLRDVVSVKDFGAAGDGVTDDTAAIQSALSEAQSKNKWALYFPPGIYVTTQPIVISVSEGHIYGAGSKNTVIRLSSTETVDFIQISDPTRIFRVQVSGIRLDYNLNLGPSNATAIRITNLSAGTFTDIDIFNFKHGIHIDGYRPDGSVNIIVDKVTIRNLGVGSGYGIRVNECVDLFVSNTTINSPAGSEHLASIFIENCQAAWFSDIDALKGQTGLLVRGLAGGIVTWLFFNQCAFDKNTIDGIRIIGESETCLIKGLNFVNCWSSSNGRRGTEVVCNAGLSNERVNGISFSSHRSVNNVREGISLSNVTDVHISNSFIAGNSKDSPGTYNGIQINANLNAFMIRGNRIGNALGYGVTHGRNILVVSGTSNNYIIAENDLRGYTLAGLLDLGAGTNKVVSNNIS